MIDLRNNRLIISIVVFLILISVIHWTKPKLMYNEHGGFRQFGIGYTFSDLVVSLDLLPKLREP